MHLVSLLMMTTSGSVWSYLPVFVLLLAELLGVLLVVFVDLLLVVAPLGLRLVRHERRLGNLLRVLEADNTGIRSVCSKTLTSSLKGSFLLVKSLGKT